MRSLQNRLPSTQAERADDLLNEATELLEQHREVTNEEDYNMARALLTIARDFRHGLERKSIICRSQQSRLYLDKVQETLETVKQVTLEGSIRIQGADASAARGNTVAIMMGAITNSEATSNDSDMVSLRTTIPAGAFTTTPLASSAPIRGPTLQVVLDHIQIYSTVRRDRSRFKWRSEGTQTIEQPSDRSLSPSHTSSDARDTSEILAG